MRKNGEQECSPYTIPLIPQGCLNRSGDGIG